MRDKYLVVVYPAQPVHRDVSMASQSWTQQHQPAVKTVTADTPQGAAATAGVPAGGHALVTLLETMERFDRAKQAPLERKMADGSLADAPAGT